jgi:hypothetical protein
MFKKKHLNTWFLLFLMTHIIVTKWYHSHILILSMIQNLFYHLKIIIIIIHIK